ncbi:MAG: hypothetical protein HKN43_16415 [Rhodothermales bacterium]|nr:hypothetical protein [Rhodothermales bacterium]
MAVETTRIQSCLALIGAGLLKADEGTIDLSRQGDLVTLMEAFLPEELSTSADAVRLGIDRINDASGDEILRDAIKLIRMELDQQERVGFLERLVEFALRDDELSFRETQYINEVASYWNIHSPTRGDETMKLWSILSVEGSEDEFTPIHHLALVYLALAHQSDKVLSEDELQAIRQKISEWLPNALPSDVNQVVADALAVYAQGPEDEVTARAIDVVQGVVPMHQRSALLADLIFVAMADNVILVEERAIIERLAAAWGLGEESGNDSE